jgi:predicted site-specific integrase-resolvase
MTLSDGARSQGITYKTVYRWFQQGVLPLLANQLPTGTILVHPSATTHAQGVALYARVSSADQQAEFHILVSERVHYTRSHLCR